MGNLLAVLTGMATLGQSQLQVRFSTLHGPLGYPCGYEYLFLFMLM